MTCSSCDGVGAMAGAHTERVEDCPACGGTGELERCATLEEYERAHETQTAARGPELRDTALTISYAAGGRYAVELRLCRDGRLFGRYTGPHRKDPSPWEERVADQDDAEHVQTINAARHLLEMYGEAEKV